MVNDYVIWSLIIKILRTKKKVPIWAAILVYDDIKWEIHIGKRDCINKKLTCLLYQNVETLIQQGNDKRGIYRSFRSKSNHIWLNSGKEITRVAQVLKGHPFGEHSSVWTLALRWVFHTECIWEARKLERGYCHHDWTSNVIRVCMKIKEVKEKDKNIHQNNY